MCFFFILIKKLGLIREISEKERKKKKMKHDKVKRTRIKRTKTGNSKVRTVMREFYHHKLHSGSHKGPIVTNPDQAKAIAMSYLK